MKGVFEKTKQTHAAMLQKVKDALQQRDDMKMQMEEAFITKEAVGTRPLLFITMLWERHLSHTTMQHLAVCCIKWETKLLYSYFESIRNGP